MSVYSSARTGRDFRAADVEHRDIPRELFDSLSALWVVVRDPTEQKALFTVFRNFPVLDVMRLMTKRLPILQDPEFMSLFEEQKMPDLSGEGIARLAALPPDTLGGGFARYCQKQKLMDTHLAYVMPPTNPSRYLIYRTTILHDVLHYVTGYSPEDVMGEMEIDAFQLAQTGAPNHVLFLIGGWSNMVLKQPHLLKEAARRVKAAYAHGKAVPSLFLLDWDAYMSKPFEAVLQELKVRE